jgi:adenylate cyclase
MSGIIQGYEYDIFISYRQKDNKYDRWVTEFVNNLRKELEATFKEEISIYFDENPHDGLLETYDIDKSLESKLKCLIFIPIISQTYCDPKSYAWHNEFLVFNRWASQDQFGRYIKLLNGNVSGRILPVQIHSLDEDDKSLLEKELGGRLRAIEFIYKESGVNRPLTPGDSPDKNQEKTFYRDQINKIANAIKEIIKSIKNPELSTQLTNKYQPETDKSKVKKSGIVISMVILLIAIGGFILFPKINSSAKKLSENSIAVLYFANISSEPDQEYFSDGITDEIIAHLSLIKGLRVISRTSMIPYKGKVSVNIREIAKQLNVATILEGSVRKAGNKLRITADLIDAHNDQHVWTEQYDRDLTDVFKIQSEIALSIADKFKINISSEANSKIKSIPTTNIKAYDLYLKAKSIPQPVGYGFSVNTGAKEYSIKLLKEAIALDPGFSQVYALWSKIYAGSDSANILAREAIARNPQLPEGYIALARTQDLDNAIRTARKLCDIDSAQGLLCIGSVYTTNAEFPSAIQYYKRAIKLDPNLYDPYLGIAYVYHYMGQEDSAEKYIKLANKSAPDSKDISEFSMFRNQFTGNPEAEIAAAKKYFADDTVLFNYVTAISYLFARDWKNAEKFYLKTNYRDMDWGLLKIKTGRKVEGISILEKSLKNRGTKGWPGDLSRIYAVLGNKEKAITEFRRLLSIGWFDIIWMRNDPYWDVLREDVEFRKMTDEVEKRNIDMLEQIKMNKYSTSDLTIVP